MKVIDSNRHYLAQRLYLCVSVVSVLYNLIFSYKPNISQMQSESWDDYADPAF